MKFNGINHQSNFGIHNLIPIFLGISCFAIVCGFNAVNPWNEQWLFGGGDATQHYLGWLFYRNSPWAWPPGLNLDYGLGLNNSIVFTDSIPLLAIPFKALSPLLPSTFQYLGLWAFICFVLQAWFAWKLVGLFTKNVLICSICTGLFIFSVPMLSLFPENPALGSLFLILAALYLSLKENSKFPEWSWFVLLVVSSLIHFYIFVLVGTLWLASMMDRLLINKTCSWRQVLRTTLVCTPMVLIATYIAGYFTISSIGAFGYGMFKINLLGLFNPAGWSTFIKEIYIKPHWWAEEPIYFGLGGLILLLLIFRKGTGLFALIRKTLHAHIFLAIAITTLAIFSISNNVGIGPYEFSVPISEKVASIASILRNSGRMFIPAYYVLLLIVCYLTVKQFSQKSALLILAGCLSLQIIDLSVGWLDVRQRMTSNGPFPLSKLPLDNPFWEKASKEYKNIIVIPSRFNLQPDFMSRFLSNEWRIFGRFASMNHLGTNAVYLARYDEPKSLELNRKYLKELNTGSLVAENLYIVAPEEINTAACTQLRSKSDLFAKIDGFYVYAPDFLKHSEGSNKIEEIKPIMIDVASSSAPYALCGTWSKPESWGTWTDGALAKIYIPLNKGGQKFINLTLKAFANSNEKTQPVELTYDGANYQKIELDKSSSNQIKVEIDSKMKSDGYALLEFKILKPISPKSLGIGDDERQLGIGLTKLEIQ